MVVLCLTILLRKDTTKSMRLYGWSMNRLNIKNISLKMWNLCRTLRKVPRFEEQKHINMHWHQNIFFTPRLLTGLVCREEISSLSISGMAVVTRQIRTGVRFSLIIVWYRGTFSLRPKWNFLDVLPKNCSRLDIPVMIWCLRAVNVQMNIKRNFWRKQTAKNWSCGCQPTDMLPVNVWTRKP